MEEEAYARKHFAYTTVYIIISVVVVFVIIDLFVIAKTKEDVFEPYYMRLTQKEKEDKIRLLQSQQKLLE